MLHASSVLRPIWLWYPLRRKGVRHLRIRQGHWSNLTLVAKLVEVRAIAEHLGHLVRSRKVTVAEVVVYECKSCGALARDMCFAQSE